MTVLVFRYGVLASDSGSFVGGIVTPWLRKIIRAADGVLYGGAGSVAGVSEFFGWVERGREGEKPLPMREGGESSFLILTWRPDWGLSLLTSEGEEDLRGCEYYAIGAGAEVAYGALYMGASAPDAVRAAIAHSTGAHGKVCEVR
jgi:hypothetical protein